MEAEGRIIKEGGNSCLVRLSGMVMPAKYLIASRLKI